MNTFSKSLLVCALGACTLAAAQSNSPSYQFRGALKGLQVVPKPAPGDTSGGSGPAPSPAPAPAPVLELSASSLAFGNVDVGQSAKRSVVLSNSGNAAASLAAPSTSGSAFSATTTCAATLPAGESCATEVTFSPATKGAQSGSLLLAGSTVPLTGTGLSLTGELTAATSAAFGQVYVSGSATRQFTFTNTGNRAADAVQASVSGSAALTLESNSCGTAASPVTLQPDASCSVTVRWSPSATGSLSGSLSIAYGGAQPATQSLTGTAVYEVLVDLQGETGAWSTPVNAGTLSMTATDVTVTTGARVSGTGGLYFGGQGVDVRGAASFGTQDFTMEAWVWPDAASYNAILSNAPDIAWGANRWNLAANHPNYANKVVFAVNNFHNSTPLLASTSTLDYTKWTHVAVTRSGSTWRLFVNGVQEASATSAVSLDGGQTLPLSVGMGGLVGNGWGFMGAMDTVKVVRGALYSANFTPAQQHVSPGSVWLQPEGFRTWSDGTLAASCNAYRNPSAPRTYSGDVGDGVYRIQPAGASMYQNVFCDMSSDGGGWTLVMRGQGGNYAGWQTTAALSASNGETDLAATGDTFKFSDTFINQVRGSTGIYRLVSDGGALSTSVKRFVAAHTYAHTAVRQTASAATTTYATSSLTGARNGLISGYLAVKTETGITDDQGNWNVLFNTGDVGSGRWWLGTGVNSTNATEAATNKRWCGGNTVGCNFNMWVR